MVRRALLGLSFVALGLGAPGCAARAVSSAGPRSVRHVDPARIAGPHVPAGTRLRVVLTSTLDTQQTSRDALFTARVETPLRALDGTVIVPAGATVRGRVASTGSRDAPRIRLDFDTVETVRGEAPLQAAVRGSQHQEYPGPTTYRLAPSPYYAYDPMFASPYGWGGYGYARGYGSGFLGPIGGGPAYVYEAYNPREVRLPAGAVLELELTRPLLPPGTFVRDER